MPSPLTVPIGPRRLWRAAKAEIQKWSGRQFDPEVVQVFVSMPDNLWENLRKQIDSQVYRFAYPPVAKGL